MVCDKTGSKKCHCKMAKRKRIVSIYRYRAGANCGRKVFKTKNGAFYIRGGSGKKKYIPRGVLNMRLMRIVKGDRKLGRTKRKKSSLKKGGLRAAAKRRGHIRE